jgi:FkbH-like protein
MKVTTGLVNDVTIARVSQLTMKTNQFNLTTKRYSISDLEKMVNEGALVLWLSVEDNFGDSGIVGVAIADNSEANYWKIDTFLLSCRVIGRKLDQVLLNILLEEIKRREGFLVYGEYIRTGKNEQVSLFYDDNGFIKESDFCWKKDLSVWKIDSPDFIELRGMV